MLRERHIKQRLCQAVDQTARLHVAHDATICIDRGELLPPLGPDCGWRTYLPIGFCPGQTWCASPSPMIATCSVSARSSSVKSRPLISGMCSVEKYPGAIAFASTPNQESPFGGTRSGTCTPVSCVSNPPGRTRAMLVQGSEDLTIEGQVEGTIELRENLLTIGPNGRIKAQVLAKTVIILGTVHGDVIASEKVEIRDGASVAGDVVSPRLAIAEGAQFHGSVDMQRGAKRTQQSNMAAAAGAKPSLVPPSTERDHATIAAASTH
jgi:cytoskeletal protein CcmA (bactofilin family)